MREANEEEIKRFADTNVYDVMDKSEIKKTESHIHTGRRWVITSTGTAESPRIKASLVAQEIADKSLKGDCSRARRTQRRCYVSYLFAPPRTVAARWPSCCWVLSVCRCPEEHVHPFACEVDLTKWVVS